MYAIRMWGEIGGSGCTLGLVIAIFIFSKREDNKAIASIIINSRIIRKSTKQLHLVFHLY